MSELKLNVKGKGIDLANLLSENAQEVADSLNNIEALKRYLADFKRNLKIATHADEYRKILSAEMICENLIQGVEIYHKAKFAELIKPLNEDERLVIPD